MNNETMMSAEDCVGEVEKGKTSTRTGKARGKKAGNNLFNELKTKMVMRIYGVSKTRALEIIAGRADEKKSPEVHADDAEGSCGDGDELMSAEEFFGMCK